MVELLEDDRPFKMEILVGGRSVLKGDTLDWDFDVDAFAFTLCCCHEISSFSHSMLHATPFCVAMSSQAKVPPNSDQKPLKIQ